MEKARIGIVGSKFAADFHADSYSRNPKAEIVAVAAIDNLEAYSSKWGIKETMTDYRDLCKRKDIDITMFYNQQMAVPLSAEERRVSRELKIRWLPFDGALRPTVQTGYLTYCDPKDHLEYELPWDKLILSPKSIW